MNPVPCTRCGGQAAIEVVRPPIPARDFDYVVTCENCNDGAPDAAPQIHGFGPTRDAAIADWNEQQDDAREDGPEIIATIVGDKATVQIRRERGIVSLRWIAQDAEGVERVNKMPIKGDAETPDVETANKYARKIAQQGDAFA